MGQINCQQCTMPFIEQQVSQMAKINQKQNGQNQINRINILSKNRNSMQIFNKKYSIQSTRQDTQQVSVSSIINLKQKCLLVLQSGKQILSLQIQNGKKMLIGTSKNCHLIMQSKLPECKFKVQVQHRGTQLQIIDMGIGLGTYIKSSLLEFKQSTQQSTQIFLIQNTLIRVIIRLSTGLMKSINVCIENMRSERLEEFYFDCIDIILNKQNRRSCTVIQSLKINFQIKKHSYQSFQFSFNHDNCWKYLKNKTLMMEDQVLFLGSSVYKVKKINFCSDLPNQSDIKIIDYD